MKSTAAALNEKRYGDEPVLYMAIEMSKAKWKVGSTDGGKIREKNCDAGDFDAFQEEVVRSKRRLKMAPDAHVVVVYEAGRDGFWPQRVLDSLGFDVLVIDPASLAVPRRRRPKKTDRVDLKRMLRALIAYCNGDDQIFAVCRVPSVRDEDDRLLERRREEINKQRTATINKIRAAIRLHTPEDVVPGKVHKQLDKLTTADGRPLPQQQKYYLRDLCERLQLFNDQLRRIETERKQLALERREDPKFQMIARLTQLRGLGDVTAWSLVMEMYGWRAFKTRGEVGAYCGLTSSPWASGSVQHDQGLSRSGNTHVRWLLIQLAWRWIRFQPDSELTRWYQKAVAVGGKARKKKIVVGLARKLAIRLWRYLESGELPRGATLKKI